ncbi:hypothetical protein XELAEV_18031567mg [Xenopus laevis]|uniref:GIY-YIG domain-containing protein n=1 Tax=Xenopus laevis TaxID=8355 RepID=A0A974HFR5_XENLA|nr:hypothetical protein XELAEV_18031567mg [Xenopus laevis]
MIIWQGPEILLKEFVAKLNVNTYNLTFTRFKTRGYKTRCLHKAYQGALAKTREDLLYNYHGPKNPTTKQNKQGQTRLILIFNDNDRDVRSVIHKHWDILTKDPTLGQLVSPRPLITYKRNTRIGDLLTHSQYQRGSRRACCKTPGTFRCGACEQCHFLKMSNTFGNDQLNFDMHHYTLCTTTFVMYLFTCHCGSMYVGKTIRMLKRCIYEHIRDIKNSNLISSIAKHIYCSHNGQYSGCFFQGIDRLHGDIRGATWKTDYSNWRPLGFSDLTLISQNLHSMDI